MWRTLAAGGQGCRARLLTVLELVLVHWWFVLVSGMGGCGNGVFQIYWPAGVWGQFQT